MTAAMVPTAAATRALGGALVSLALLGCGNDPVDLGTDPAFLWWTDHETGDLADWTRGGAAMGASYEIAGGTIGVETGHTRSGHFALVSTTPATPPAAAMTAGQVTRKSDKPPDGYYGAWFYVPAFARATTYWVFFSFHSGADVVLWDVKLAPTGAGALTLQLFHHDTGDVTPLRDVAVPLGSWFQVQAYYRATGDADDALRIWLDDALVFEVDGPDAAGAAGVGWILGSITDGLAPGPVALSIDDAFIATRRIDPHAGPFWRGP
jgi:hypothetical protein